MRVSDYTYDLPDELVAQFPPAVRGTTRLLILDRKTGQIQHGQYKDLAQYVRPGDIVVLNNTKVIRARLAAQNASGQPRELLLLEDQHNTDFTQRRVLYKGKIRAGEQLRVGDATITVDSVEGGGIARISSNVNLLELAEHTGTVPLPPYMHRDATAEDIQRYQTVFAKEPGSVAAPTASLNFTELLQAELTQKGAQIAHLTLHVGLGTFLPIRVDDLQSHKMHSEYYEIPTKTIRLIQAAKQKGGRIIAIGTTVTRTLEYAAEAILNQDPHDLSGEADIFIYPSYEFKIVDGLLTNFHAPRSTVLMLTAAFASWPHLQQAYKSAIQEKYAFLSYGDSMLII